MKKSLRIALVVLMLALPLAFLNAQSYKLASASKLWIDGTSTMHDWKCDAKGFTGSFTIPDAVFGAKAGEAVAISTSINVPVNKIWHEKEDLVENLQEALEVEKYANIKFTLTSATIVSSDANSAKVKVTGKLNIHGVEKTNTFDVTFTKNSNGMDVKGVSSFKMSEFGVKPPTMFLGTIKTGDALKIGFDLDLTK